ncbi:DUF397 domain-containing protein [Streptomyces sp. NPDC059479]|uniref:DUF397 domain-containing protein n=1 Tax=Streptomyces sp. NPDC059479 TaxID=3346848 RepID=UPI003699797B
MRHTPELSTAGWRKSSYSNTNGGNCVEITEDFPGIVPVRDSKTPNGPALIIPAGSWTTFITAFKPNPQA